MHRVRPLLFAVVFVSAALVACSSDRSAAGPDRIGTEDDGRGATGRDTGSASVSDAGAGGTDVAVIDLDTGTGIVADAEPDAPEAGRGGLVVADPSTVFITFVGPGEVIDMPMRIRNNSDVPVTVRRVELVDPDPGFVVFDDPVELELGPGETVSYSLRYETGDATTASAEIYIHTSLGTAIVVPVTASAKAGTVDEPPCVDIRPRRIDFGPVERGSVPTAPRDVTITNCGEADIVISRFDRATILFFPTPASFQWTHEPLPIPLGPGETSTLQVSYSPGRVGSERGGIDVRTNVPGSETVRVELLGESVLPPITELDVHLLLRWDVSGGSDVDFHFLADGDDLFSSDDCYFGNMTPDWGVRGSTLDDPFLDVDDLEGPGPENINVDELADGRYRIVVHYYSDTGSGGGGGGGFGVSTNATVDVYLGGTLAATYGPKRLERTGATWNVATLDWPAGTLTELGDVYFR